MGNCYPRLSLQTQPDSAHVGTALTEGKGFSLAFAEGPYTGAVGI